MIVAAMLDFLTFALCAPYSETTDGKQFDVLLEKVADRGRTLYRLFQQPSHTIVKVRPRYPWVRLLKQLHESCRS